MLPRFLRNFSDIGRRRISQKIVHAGAEEATNLKTTEWMRDRLRLMFENMRGMPVEALDATKLEPRRMRDSYSQFTIPLEQDAEMRLKYSTAGGNVRFGRILEDLDLFSVWLCYLHDHGAPDELLRPRHARVVVTGSVDRIDLQNFDFAMHRDLILDGHVSWAGRSSMQTTMRIYQHNEEGNLEQMLKAKFVMVSRHPKETEKTMAVHPLVYPTPEEAFIFNQGVDDILERSRMDAKSVFRCPPTNEEYRMIHEKFVQSTNRQGFASTTLPDGHVWLEDRPFCETLMPCYPENKNIYGKIFGGFLMRSAFDLAAMCSKVFAKTSTELIAVSDIVFRAPVEVGDVLALAAHITFTHQNFIQVRVQAQVVNEKTFERKTTNTFHFTFTTRNKSAAPKIMPQAYKQGMLYQRCKKENKSPKVERKSDPRMKRRQQTQHNEHTKRSERIEKSEGAQRGDEIMDPVERAFYAKKVAHRTARLGEHHTVETVSHKYKVIQQIQQGPFGFTFKVKQLGTDKLFAMRTEPTTKEEQLTRFKTLKNELIVLRLFKELDKSKCDRFVQLIDSGSTENFNFIVLTLLGDNLYTITHRYINRAFTPSTALRVSIQMLRALMDLHALGYVHRFLKPHTFAVGLNSRVCFIHMCEFPLAWQFRYSKTIKPPRRRVKIMGALRYTSRNSHHNRELSRRDDLESWLYLSLEFFQRSVLPWRSDRSPASVLFRKTKFFNNEYPEVFKKTSFEYRNIMSYISKMKFDEAPDYAFLMQCLQNAKVALRCDFTLPYDWEYIYMKTVTTPSAEIFVEPAEPLSVEPVEPLSAEPTKPLCVEHTKPPYAEPAKPQPATEPQEKPSESKFVQPTMNTQRNTAYENFSATTNITGHDVLIDVQMERSCENIKDKRTKSHASTASEKSKTSECETPE
ncbi:hypothetical protein QR680_018455 [Steinernema hermaphroditum]|uniref:Protein kinase domain-containing protein n=1 Tax=Steinernema hermaphroditum TaxID=289476 RepID=A0AA39HIU9_9BILA|nr:hypothetical protein QR680_018455 [Steinernema hermaphroditum]